MNTGNAGARQSAYDVMWGVIAFAPMVLAIVALVSLSRSRAVNDTLEMLVWALLIVLVPFLGAVAWLLVGRRLRQAGTSTQ